MTPPWWQRAIIYQIYPRSFMDANGDGVGDLAGIRRRLGYLQWLGVDAVWLSPIFRSPMADFGYDVSDYLDIDPVFGTLADFDALIAEAHAAGIKLLLDFVPNHTSDRHPWFLESRASRDAARHGWYIWRDPAPGGGPPTNWLSHFGGSAWEWDEATGQYYYHAFLKEQPDLNWRHPEVVRAMLDVLRFWLDRGVDGFRVDVIWHLIKDDQFRDNPPNPEFREGMSPYRALLSTYSADRPEVHEVIEQMRRVLAGYGDRVLLGEIYLPVERLVHYYGTDGRLPPHLPFNFTLLQVPWNARALAAAIEAYERVLPARAWPTWVLGNHDRPRVASRVGARQARTAAMLLLTLRGTPTLYYGDELGLPNGEIPPDRLVDPRGRNLPGLSRDPSRTPMPWDSSRNAGFTEGRPWLPLAAGARSVDVAAEQADARSMLALHRRLIALRRSTPALLEGRLDLDTPRGHVLSFRRTFHEAEVRVALNLSSEPAEHALPRGGRVLVSTALDRQDELVAGRLALRPDEGVVVAT